MKLRLCFFAAILLVAISFAQQRPNFLFIILDDAGLDMGSYGSTYVNTPAFDRIAAEGILFENAYTPNAKCAPSRAAILTGRNSWQLDAAANHVIYFPYKFKTFQEVLRDNGYTIGYTGKGYAPGKAQHQDQSPRELVGPAFNSKQLAPPTSAISSNDYTGNFRDFLESAPNDRPWSFWIGTLEPHRSYSYRSGVELGKKSTDMITNFPGYWPDNEITRNDLLDYAYEIEYADNHVLKILASLEASGELNNTLVIMTSDHGMPFPRVKGDQYEHSNHVPMALMWGDKVKAKGSRVSDHISFIDLAPTFLDIAGIHWQDSGMHPAAGRSFLNIITSGMSGQIDINRNYVLVGKERHDTGRPADVG
ncbi:MAG: sulfatase, partial [Eudoraea sp.]|nr:sulfatase [Eudoraea sp.]